MKINVPFDLSNLKDQDDITRYMSQSFKQIVSVINGGIEFEANMNVKVLSCIFGVVNSNTAFDHTLERVPSGYIVITNSSGMIVYDGSTANTDKVIYLRSTVAGTAKVMIF